MRSQQAAGEVERRATATVTTSATRCARAAKRRIMAVDQALVAGRAVTSDERHIGNRLQAEVTAFAHYRVESFPRTSALNNECCMVKASS